MDAAPDTRRQLGQLMVEEGLLSAEELAHALQEQNETGKPLGETLVALGYASPGAVANALAEQHGGLLRTEFGVSTGLRTVTDGERPALHAAPPVAPVSSPAGGEHEHRSETGAPLGAGLRLAGAPAPAPALAPANAPTVEPPAAPAKPEAAPAQAEERLPELAKFASLHADLDAARAELDQKSKHLLELTGRLDDTVSQLRVSQAARDAFAARAAELEAQTGTTPDPAEAARVDELQAQVQELTKVVEAAEASSQAATAHTQVLEGQLEAAGADRDALQAKLVEAETPIAPDPQLTARVQELQAQADELKKSVADAEAASHAETARSTALQAQLETVAAGRDALVEQVAGLQAKLNDALTAPALAAPDHGFGERIKELELLLQAAAADRDALQAKLLEAAAPVAPDPELTARVQELQAQAEKLTRSVADAQAAGQTETARRMDLEEKLKTVTADRDALHAKLAEAGTPTAAESALTARTQELEAQLQAVTVERDGLVQSLTELQSRLGDTAQAREAEVARANAVAAARVTAIESRLQAAETERDAFSQTCEELQGKLNTITATHNASLDKLEEQLADREQRLAERADARATIEREHQAVLGQLVQEKNTLAERFEELQSGTNETKAAHETALANLEAQLVEREHRLAKRADERVAIEQQHEALLEQLELERNALAASFDELQGLMNETTAAHETAFAKLDEQLASRDRVLSDRTEEMAQLTRDHVAALAELAHELEQERARAAEAAAAAVVPEEGAHVVLVPAFTGYLLVERLGPAPDARDVVEIGPGTWGEGRFVVSRIGPSPLPDGPKHCAFLERP